MGRFLTIGIFQEGHYSRTITFCFAIVFWKFSWREKFYWLKFMAYSAIWAISCNENEKLQKILNGSQVFADLHVC